MRICDVLLILSVVTCVYSFDMFAGDVKHRKMVFHQRVKEFAIPFKKRIQTLTYKDSDNRKIQGIAVLDNDYSHASANITAGGVGQTFVTIRMKSQRHHPLNMEVEVYI